MNRQEEMETDKNETMSQTHPIPPIPTTFTARERNFIKIKTSFRDGILQEYGSVKFSEIKDDDPLLYAHSRRPKAILQAKALRHLDKTLGLGPQAYGEKHDLNRKERRKRANRLTYENGVIGNRAVQECIKELFMGCNLRLVSQELQLSRLQTVNAQLGKQVNELKKKKMYRDSFQEQNVGCLQICQSTHEVSTQTCGKEQSMAQGNVGREISLRAVNSRDSSSFPYPRTYPTELQPIFTTSSGQAHGINDQRRSRAIPHERHMALSAENRLSQQQQMYYFDNQQPGAFQPHHLQPSQLQCADQQGMSSSNNQVSRSQLFHPSVNVQGSPQGVFLPVNQSPPYFLHRDQTSFATGPNYYNHNYTAASQIVDLGRQNTFFQVMCPNLHPQTPVHFGQQMATTQEVKGDGSGISLTVNPVIQNGQIQTVVPHWNAVIPMAHSDAISPDFLS